MKGAKAGKVWGTTRQIFDCNNVEIHDITTHAGGYCSKHRHRHKHNAFYVFSGRLLIRVWKNNYDLVDETIVGPGEYTIVPASEYHQFEALEDTMALEVYWVSLDPDDIERETVGGL